jgi:predicted KAP-like P-loop ATPase
MWSDNDTKTDLIDFSHFIQAVISIIKNDSLEPCTIGIYGDWGSGKSSLVEMMEYQLNSNSSDESILVIKFNGWLFEGYEDAKSVLLGTLIEKIAENRNLGTKAKEIAKKLLKKVDWFKVIKSTAKYGASFALAGPAGLGLAAFSAIPKELSEIDYEKFLKSDQEEKDENLRMSIRNFHTDFVSLLSETKIKKLVVIIDDLDRCNPDTVIETLEAIKLFLFVSKTAFIISADEKLIQYAVGKRFPKIQGQLKDVSRDYLEKLIQIPIKIPPLSTSEMETYINLLFTSLYIKDDEFELIRSSVIGKKKESVFGSVYNIDTAKSFSPDGKLSGELEKDLILSAQITPILAAGLNGNPRQCKRFLNTLLLRFEMAKNKNLELEKRILSKLMLLEYFKPETFKLIFDLQLNQNGKPKELGEIEKVEKEGKSKIQNGNAESVDQIIYVDEWMENWIKIDPPLSNIDLRPYYYFSRESLTVTSPEIMSMSPQAKEIFTKLTSESEAIKKTGLNELNSLSLGDVSSIFSAFTKNIKIQENPTIVSAHLKTLIELCKKRTEMLTEMISYFESFPESQLTIAIIPQIESAVKGTSHVSKVNSVLFSKWANSETNKQLAGVLSKRIK